MSPGSSPGALSSRSGSAPPSAAAASRGAAVTAAPGWDWRGQRGICRVLHLSRAGKLQEVPCATRKLQPTLCSSVCPFEPLQWERRQQEPGSSWLCPGGSAPEHLCLHCVWGQQLWQCMQCKQCKQCRAGHCLLHVGQSGSLPSLQSLRRHWVASPELQLPDPVLSSASHLPASAHTPALHWGSSQGWHLIHPGKISWLGSFPVPGVAGDAPSVVWWQLERLPPPQSISAAGRGSNRVLSLPRALAKPSLAHLHLWGCPCPREDLGVMSVAALMRAPCQKSPAWVLQAFSHLWAQWFFSSFTPQDFPLPVERLREAKAEMSFHS